MSETHSIRNGVISTVIGGAILGALGSLWPPAAHLFGAIWKTLISSVAVPVWALGVAALTLVVSLVAAVRRFLETSAAPSPVSVTASSVRIARLETPNTSDLETHILKRLVEADGASVSVTALLRATGATKLRVQAAIESLESANLVEVSDDPGFRDTEVYLTSEGRQHVVQQGLA